MTGTFRVAARKFKPFETAMAKQWAAFRATGVTNLEIEIVAFDLEPLHRTLFDPPAAAEPWDLAFMPTDWIAEAQAKGVVVDLRPLMAEQPIPDFPNAWTPSLLAIQDYAGGFWGFPYHDGPQCLIYRTDLLAAAGLEVPRDWPAFHAAARRLHDPAREIEGTVLALFPDGHNSFYDFCVQIWTRGGSPFASDGRATLLTSEADAALTFLRTLAADRDATAADLTQIDSVASGLRFCDGRVALMANWFGFAALGASWDMSRVRGNVGIAPLPGDVPVSLNVFWMLTIPGRSTRRDLAWSFTRHCATGPMDRLLSLEGGIGVRRSTWIDPAVNAIVPFSHQLDGLHEVARMLPRHPRLSQIAHVVDLMMTSAVTSERATADLLAEAQSGIEAITG